MEYNLPIEAGVLAAWMTIEDSRGGKIDIIDAAIITYIKKYRDPESYERMKRNKSGLVWLSFKNFLDQIPLLRIKPQAIGRRLRKIEEIGLIRCETEYSKAGGTFCYYGLSRMYNKVESWWSTYLSAKTDEDEIAIEELDKLRPVIRKKAKKIIKFHTENRDNTGKFTVKVVDKSVKKKSRTVSKGRSRTDFKGRSRTVSKGRSNILKEHIKRTSENSDFLSNDLFQNKKENILSATLCQSCETDLTEQRRKINKQGLIPVICQSCGAADLVGVTVNEELAKVKAAQEELSLVKREAG